VNTTQQNPVAEVERMMKLQDVLLKANGEEDHLRNLLERAAVGTHDLRTSPFRPVRS